MASNWALPTIIEQYSESNYEDIHIPWISENNFENIKTKNGKHLKLSRDILHIARDPKTDIKEKTYFLKCTGFNFINLPTIISGIELKLTANRFGRITDDTIQLIFNNELLGENLASLTLEQTQIYGDRTDKWNTTITIENVLTNLFGVVIRFKSHPNWPHKSNIFVDSVELRIH